MEQDACRRGANRTGKGAEAARWKSRYQHDATCKRRSRQSRQLSVAIAALVAPHRRPSLGSDEPNAVGIAAVRQRRPQQSRAAKGKHPSAALCEDGFASILHDSVARLVARRTAAVLTRPEPIPGAQRRARIATESDVSADRRAAHSDTAETISIASVSCSLYLSLLFSRYLSKWP